MKYGVGKVNVVITYSCLHLLIIMLVPKWIFIDFKTKMDEELLNVRRKQKVVYVQVIYLPTCCFELKLNDLKFCIILHEMNLLHETTEGAKTSRFVRSTASLPTSSYEWVLFSHWLYDYSILCFLDSAGNIPQAVCENSMDKSYR